MTWETQEERRFTSHVIKQFSERKKNRRMRDVVGGSYKRGFRRTCRALCQIDILRSDQFRLNDVVWDLFHDGAPGTPDLDPI